MGYSLWLEDKPGHIAQGEKRRDFGNMYSIDGSTELSYNVTYNYDPYFKAFGDERLREIYGKTGSESILMLVKARQKIWDTFHENGKWKTKRVVETKFYDGGEKEIKDIFGVVAGTLHAKRRVEITKEVSEGDTSNYWTATAANAIKALDALEDLAKQCPHGKWFGD